jgi:hypothetical protein
MSATKGFNKAEYSIELRKTLLGSRLLVSTTQQETSDRHLHRATHASVLRRKIPRAPEDKIARQLFTNNVLHKSGGKFKYTRWYGFN